jgi:hypothetical protein
MTWSKMRVDEMLKTFLGWKIDKSKKNYFFYLFISTTTGEQRFE